MQVAQTTFTVVTESLTEGGGELEYGIKKCPEDCFANLSFHNYKTKQKLEPRSCA